MVKNFPYTLPAERTQFRIFECFSHFQIAKTVSKIKIFDGKSSKTFGVLESIFRNLEIRLVSLVDCATVFRAEGALTFESQKRT